MDFLAISYTFRLAGDELRSQLSFTPEQKAGFEQQMIAAGLCRECLILSTCNRVEFYLAGELSDHHQLIPLVYQALSDNKGLATSTTTILPLTNICPVTKATFSNSSST